MAKLAWRQRRNPFPHCCRNPPPLSLPAAPSASSFPFSSLAALSVQRQWLVVVCSEVEVEVVAVVWLRHPVDLRPQRILTPAPPPPPPRVRHCPTASGRHHPPLPPLPLLLLHIPLLPLPRGVNRREGVPLPRLTPSSLARRASLLRQLIRQAALVALPCRPRLWRRRRRRRRRRHQCRRQRGPAAIPITATMTTNPPSSRPSRLPQQRCLYRPPPERNAASPSLTPTIWTTATTTTTPPSLRPSRLPRR